MDSLGNRTGDQTLSDETVNFTVQSSTNRYTSIGGSSISHDDAGNLTTDRQGYVYSYDYENRVVKIDDSSSNDVAEYAFDALGRRIRMIDKAAEPDVPTLYYYNPDWQCLAEYNGAGALQRYFIYGNYIDEPLIMHRQSDGEDYYYGHDHLYSTVVLLDDGGNVVERYEYDAYGTTHIMDASYNSRSVSAYSNPYGFTGRDLDILDNGNLTHNHLRHRDTDLYTGRFLQQDPRGVNPGGGTVNKFGVYAQYGDGLNLYQPAMSNPALMHDPYGLWCGVVVKQQNVNFDEGQMGHAWIEGGGPSFGWWPAGPAGILEWWLGMDGMVMSPDDHEGDTYDLMWVTRRKLSGTMLYGRKAGKPCKCIQECADVTSCLDHFRTKTHGQWAGLWGSGLLLTESTYFIGDCRRFTNVVIDFCCLERVLVFDGGN